MRGETQTAPCLPRVNPIPLYSSPPGSFVPEWEQLGHKAEVRGGFGGAGSEGRQVARLLQEEGCVSPNFREVWGWMKLARGRLAKPDVWGGGRF